MHQNSTLTDNALAHLNKLLATVVLKVQGEYLVTLEDRWGDVFVIEDSDFRALKFDEFYEQSKMRISEPHVPVFNYIKAMLLGAAFAPCDDVLILGLGGGSLVRALHYLNTQTKMTVVEIRPAVVELAFQYFAMPATPFLTIVCDDAKVYLQQQSERYDVIFADLFWAMRMDPMQAKRQFVQACKSQLHPHGWLVINYEQHADIDEKLIKLFYRYFDDVLLCAIPNGNAVLLVGSLEASGGMSHFYTRLGALEERLACKMDILGRKLQRIPNPLNIST